MGASPRQGVIELDAATCRDQAAATSREWLLADGLGGYASGTVSGMPTRRYHGLLLAATDPPAGRTLLVHSVHERVLLGAQTIELDANTWSDDSIAPRGFEYLVGFKLEGRTPTWTWEIDGLRLERRIALHEGVLEVRWSLPEGTHPIHLQYEIVVSNRSHHELLDASDVQPPSTTVSGEHAVITWPSPPDDGVTTPLQLRATGTLMARTGWWRGFRLPIETARGFDDLDDAWHAATCTVEVTADRPATFHASLDETALEKATDLVDLARSDDHRIIETAGATPQSLKARLALAADQFIARRPLPGGGTGATILAGFPWFADWGRDTMLALPGLALATGRLEEATSILRTFAAHEQDGLIPNLFPDDGTEPKFNTVDASLLFIEATRRWFAVTEDADTLRILWPTVQSIIRHYTDGTRHGIGTDPKDGLVHAGEPGLQLTWMDARVGDRVITPRMGKPVEINALWHAGLETAARFAEHLGEDANDHRAAAERVHVSFERFWNPETGCLFDVLDGPDGADASIRPNQLLAIALQPALLDPERARSVLEVVDRELLVPDGVRTLDPDDADFIPHYGGGPAERDAAYHQGTAWPWLLGPWMAAHRAVDPARCRALEAELRARIADHLLEAGLGSVSEILDATDPFTPRGCFAQAWSVGAILDAITSGDPDDGSSGDLDR